MDKEEPLG